MSEALKSIEKGMCAEIGRFLTVEVKSKSSGSLARPPIFGNFELLVGRVFSTSGGSTSTDESVPVVSRIGLSEAGQCLTGV